MKALVFDRTPFQRLADGLAVLLAASLPWSTSATGILAVLWLAAAASCIDLAALRRLAATPAALMPLLLVALGLAGMLWAEVSWSERFNGAGSFLKLLFMPILLCHFSRSERAQDVLIGFVGSCTLLLAYSWALFFWPELPAPGAAKGLSIPVKDYIAQGAMFTISIFLIARLSIDQWRRGRRYQALALTVLSMIFLLNIFYIATSRTSLVVFFVLLVLLGYRQFGWRGMIGLAGAALFLGAIAWPSATYLQLRVSTFFSEVQTYGDGGGATSAGERLEFWKKSVRFIQDAPVLGHGTGSIREQFSRAAVGQSGVAAEVSANPHNQILAVGIQLGFIGIFFLLVMWVAHLSLFLSQSFSAWTGFVIVVQNIIGSLFNSHLFDFTQGWTYVVGVGIAGGLVLKNADTYRHEMRLATNGSIAN